MKRLILVLILFMPLVMNAQKTFTIDGFGKGLKDGDKIFLLYRAFGAEKSVFDSTVVVNSAFKFRGNVTSITKCGIYRNTNPMYANTILDQFSIYLEPGNILMKSADTLNNSVVSGTPLNKDYMELLSACRPVWEEMTKLLSMDDLNVELRKDTLFVANLNRQRKSLNDKIQSIQFDFIKKHPHSFVSLPMLNELSADAKLLNTVETVFPLLSVGLREMPMADHISRRIEFAKKITVGMMAKDFVQANAEGRPIQLLSYKGKYVLIDFWASWCLPCRDENPNLVAAYQKYHGKGFEILGVSLDDKTSKTAWLKAIADDGLVWKQVTDFKGWKNEVAILYGITSIPSNVLIDASGKIIAKNLKGEYLNDYLLKLFKAL